MPVLCGVSLLCLMLGGAHFYVQQQLDYVTSALCIIGGITLLVLLIVINKPGSARNTPAILGSAFTVKSWIKIAMVFSAILGSVIFISASHYLATNSNVRWDITQDKQHTLSSYSMEYLGSLTNEVRVTALHVGIPPKYLIDLFNEYERVSGGIITTEIVDPIEQIAYAAKFGAAIKGNENKVIVQSGNNRKDVDFTLAALSEEKLTHAIAAVNRPPRTVYFLTGHNEYSIDSTENNGLAKFKQLLADNNIRSENLMLGINPSIPADCDVLIIAGPRSALSSHEETLVVDYLHGGGDALILIEHTLVTTPDKPLSAAQLAQNPSLNTILNRWGLDVQADIVVDFSNHVGGDVGSPATKNYQPHKALTEGLDYTFYVRPRSITVLPERRETIKHAIIASTTSSENSWAESNRMLDIQFDPSTDTLGPVPFSYVVIEPKSEAKGMAHKKLKPSDTRLIVFTDADFLSNVYIEQFSNAQMGLNLVNWLAELDYHTFVPTKDIKVERLDLTSKQLRQVLVILFFMPFLCVVVGLVLWLSKNK